MRSFVDFGKNHKLPAVPPAYWKLAETASKVEERTVRIAIPPHYRTLRYLIQSGWCESCNRQVSQKVRGVLPRFSVANPLLAQNVMDRFVYGMTVGTISARTGIGKGTLFSEYARLSEILKPCTE